MDNQLLSEQELERYSRHLILPGFGRKGQEKLKAAKVLVIGAGGLGSAVLKYIAAAGTGHIGIIDNDTVSVNNLQRQVLYDTRDVGYKKTDIAKKKLSSLNPHVNFTIYDSQLTRENSDDIIKNYDLVIDCSDNYETRYTSNDSVLRLDKPLVFGSVKNYEGQLSVFNYHKGPNYRDLYPDPPDESNTPESDLGIMGVLPGIIGCLQVNEAIKIITGTGEILSGKLVVINLLTNSFTTLQISKTGKN
ncbi:MAG: HesA/MoeB/ThiF family protein [Bacteroidales bacterium]|nr:MAG: HesA/MoeB/ThiF family protein [Bacteroidales bacterium]